MKKDINNLINFDINKAKECINKSKTIKSDQSNLQLDSYFDFDFFNNTIEYSTIKLEYLNLLIFLIFSIFLSVLILFLSYYLAQQNPNSEKLSAYECGFEPYDDTRHSFDVKFCVIAILFVVFDVEIMFLIPWCVSITDLNLLGIWVLIDFLFELIIGFFYVWYSGALDWKFEEINNV